MRFAVAAFFIVLLGGPAIACQIDDPFPFNSDEDCSANAQRLMERIGGCLDLANADTGTKKRAATVKDSVRKLQCDRLTCDFDAMGRDDGEMVRAYIERTFTDEPEFRGTFPPTKSCKPPVKPKAKTAPKKPVVKSAGKQPIKSTSGATVKSKSTPPPKPVKKKQEK